MPNNRLKLYNSKLTIRLNKTEKELCRKNAYKNKVNMSEYIRALILIDNRKNTISSNIVKNNKMYNEIIRAEIRIGRDI